MTNEKMTKIRERIAKLLRLAESPNPHEAAAAAGQAQALMAMHAISEAELHVDDAEEQVGTEDLGKPTKTNVAWRNRLAAGIARANRCAVYIGWATGRKRQIKICGSAADVSTVRYLFAALYRMCNGSVRKAQQVGAIRGRSESNAFRHGWVTAVTERLQAASQDARQHASGAALMRLDQLAVRAEQALPEGLRKARPAQYRGDDAYRAGRRAGKRAQLDSRAGLAKGAAGRLTVHKQLGSG